ncbi:MAG: DUF484 family protein [Alphaproteobacteria bacterium]
MTDTQSLPDKLKEEILRDPAVVLDDSEVMRALLESTDKAKGENVLDLRSIFVARLEERLDRLEDTHRSVVAVAYENLAGNNQIQRAVITLLSADTLAEFVQALNHDVANVLGVDVIRLCIEGDKPHGGRPVDPENPDSSIIVALPTDGVTNYITGQRSGPDPKQITLRRTTEAKSSVFGNAAVDVTSEAVLRLDIGGQTARGLVAFGSFEDKRFAPDQGTDLLVFLAHAIERILRRWVA